MINGKRLKELRKAKNLSQTELGEILGVSKSSICCYENGTRNPALETIIDLMHLFGVSADYLLGTDNLIKVVENHETNYRTLTNEELLFLDELKKNKFVYDILLDDPKRGADLIKNKIG
ncbi:MAG: helix-turn-helix transcriptional regulator [Bacilli bacterium]|nr:helix-turn-helix transcriptional regulator [Bacilli bacterium]